MSLYDRATFEEICLRLPQATLVRQWGDTSVLKVGGKMFATYGFWNGGDRPEICFKCSDMSFDLLPELEGVQPAKYLARAKWVAVMETAPLTQDDLMAYLTEAHRLVAAKLPKSAKSKLGLTGDQYSKP